VSARVRARRSWLAAAVVVLGALLRAAPALAQEFEKVTGSPTQEVPAVPFVGIAYAFIWIAVLVYVISVARGLRRVRGELDELRRKLDVPPADRR
jgi:CcmD family protein